MKKLNKQVQAIFEEQFPTELKQHYKPFATTNGGRLSVELIDHSDQRVFGSSVDVSLQPRFDGERAEGVEISSASIRFTEDDAAGIATLYFLQRAFAMRKELEKILLKSDADQREQWLKEASK